METRFTLRIKTGFKGAHRKERKRKEKREKFNHGKTRIARISTKTVDTENHRDEIRLKLRKRREDRAIEDWKGKGLFSQFLNPLNYHLSILICVNLHPIFFSLRFLCIFAAKESGREL